MVWGDGAFCAAEEVPLGAVERASNQLETGLTFSESKLIMIPNESIIRESGPPGGSPQRTRQGSSTMTRRYTSRFSLRWKSSVLAHPVDRINPPDASQVHAVHLAGRVICPCRQHQHPSATHRHHAEWFQGTRLKSVHGRSVKGYADTKRGCVASTWRSSFIGTSLLGSRSRRSTNSWQSPTGRPSSRTWFAAPMARLLSISGAWSVNFEWGAVTGGLATSARRTVPSSGIARWPRLLGRRSPATCTSIQATWSLRRTVRARPHVVRSAL